MFQIDEKVISDDRSLITIQDRKHNINPVLKNGTLNYTHENNDLWLTTPKVRKAYIAKDDHAVKYDKVLLARDGVNVDGDYVFEGAMSFKDNVEMKKDLIIRGNLTVEGNSTVIDTPSLSIEDNLIELNRNEEGNGISLDISGSAINRGSKSFARNLFNETSKAFITDISELIDGPFSASNNKWVTMGIAEDSNEGMAGEFKVRRKLTVPVGLFNDSIQVLNNTVVNNLSATGEINFTGTSTFATTTINGVLTANNIVNINNNLTVNKPALFNDAVNMKKTLQVDKTSLFKEAITANEKLTITGGGLETTGAGKFNNTLEVVGTTKLKNDLTVTGLTRTTNLDVLENATVKKNLTVDIDAIVKNNLEVHNNFTVDNLTNLNGQTTVDNILTINGETNINNDLSINGGDLMVSSSASAGGNINIQNSISAYGNLAIRGESMLNGDVNINGDLSMLNSVANIRNLILEEKLIFRSGNNNGIEFDGSDRCKIYHSTSEDPISGGHLDGISTENMYFKNTASTRGFVFKSENTPIVQITSAGRIYSVEDIYSRGDKVITEAKEGHDPGGNNLDADKLDGLHGYDFLRRNVDTNTTASILFAENSKGISFKEGSSITEQDGKLLIKASDSINKGISICTESGGELLQIKNENQNGIYYKDKKIWHSGNDGAGSTLDADLLDGRQGSDYSLTTHHHDDSYIHNDEVNLKRKYKIEYNEEFDSLDFMYMG